MRTSSKCLESDDRNMNRKTRKYGSDTCQNTQKQSFNILSKTIPFSSLKFDLSFIFVQKLYFLSFFLISFQLVSILPLSSTLSKLLRENDDVAIYCIRQRQFVQLITYTLDIHLRSQNCPSFLMDDGQLKMKE